MQCGKCNFIVPANMRFCLMKNMCPSCGSPLFTDSDMTHLSMLQNRISSQAFSKTMDKVQIYDLGLFIYNEIQSGYGRTIVDAEVKKFATISSGDKEGEVLYNQEGSPPKPVETDPELIRKEVEAELREQISANLDDDDVIEMGNLNEPEDDRLKRLKAQANKHNKSLTGVSVRRAG
jgi:hypothetical protein